MLDSITQNTPTVKKKKKSTVYVGMKSNNVVIRLTQFLRKSGEELCVRNQGKKNKKLPLQWHRGQLRSLVMLKYITSEERSH